MVGLRTPRTDIVVYRSRFFRTGEGRVESVYEILAGREEIFGSGYPVCCSLWCCLRRLRAQGCNADILTTIAALLGDGLLVVRSM